MYQKPMIISAGTAEGVYMASGNLDAPGCDSEYMGGIWQPQDHSAWGTETRGYKQQFGCLGCPANTGYSCGLLSHYEEAGQSGTYDVDAGNRKPTWEAKGYGPEEEVTDWNM